MSIVSESLDAGFAELLTVAGETVTVNGHDHVCVASETGRWTTLTIGGQELEVTATFEFLTSGWFTADMDTITMDSTLYTVDSDTGVVRPGITCTYRGIEYRVANVYMDPSASRVRFTCVSPSK